MRIAERYTTELQVSGELRVTVARMLIRAWVSACRVWRIETHGAAVADRLGSRELVDRRLVELGAPPLTEMRTS